MTAGKIDIARLRANPPLVPWRPQRPFRPPTISEAEAVEYWVEVLQPSFHIEHEVPGQSPTGRRYRLDMLLHPRFDWPSGGRNPIGFEVKRPSTDVATFTKAFGQATDYAQAEWFSGLHNQPLRIYVAIHDNYTDGFHPDARFLAERIAGRQNVAFIRIDKWRGVTLETSGERRWSLTDGPSRAAFNAIPKDGSR